MKKRKILFIYIIVGLLWIFITDLLVGGYSPAEWTIYIQKIKGFIYVAITAVLLYYVLKKSEELNNSKEEKEKLATLINSMVDFVIFKDGEGRWLEANDFSLKLFQLENVDFRGKRDSELAIYTDLYHDALIFCEKSDEDTWRNRKNTQCEEKFPFPDGTVKYFDTIKVPVFHEDGSRKGLVVIGRDTTDKKHAEEQLRKSEKLSVVGELAASVGHEIRNPLTSIKGFLQLLRKNDDSNDPYYKIMLKELERIDHIVGELLVLAKPQKIHFSKYDIKEIVTDIVSLLETQANMNNVKINFDTNEEFWIECEQNLLKQLFVNILKNAIEASDQGGNIWVRLEKSSSKFVRIVIEDEGNGISEEFLKRLGEPFYSSKEKGTGLGLTVSHKIVEQHEGQIRFKSQENTGTTVEIELPVKSNKHM